jgi:hypothetical protein
MARMDIDIDWDDFLYDCSSNEKQKIIDSLYDDGYVPKNMDDDEFKMEAESNTEVELIQTLRNIWNNRLFLNNKDLEELNYYANKGAYDDRQ